ncbi:MAG: deoxyribodipyrimidine photo-lyase [Bryobacteraceae bacterium]|nr:deoxyribodipyrimidine photo-lyase [Bryobacteraceae bacterium]
MNVVWFKRDLRIVDHRPLAEAAERGAVLPLYIYEPSVWNAPDSDPRHWRFVRESLIELRDSLAKLGAPLVVRVGEALDVLRSLPVTALWSHEETGNAMTYARDRAVRKWAREAKIPFIEFPTGGVVRRLKSRDGWSKIWERRVAEPVLEAPMRLDSHGLDPGAMPELRPTIDTQPGGERAAHAVLDSFLGGRGENYYREMSSPITAETGCSRLSAHLAWGTISTRQVVQAVRRAAAKTESANWKKSLGAFDARMHWRCHFMQKLEDEPRIEFENFVRAYDGLRGYDEDRFSAWAEGRTGFPFIDACMRSLAATGWINFRMRAMLVSFASYHLWLDWRPTALHLARLFTDYEPGIHYSQTQMQSGTTGINTLRIYSPVKQAEDQDPKGEFVRRWVPEFGAGHYPAPIVDHRAAMREARDKIWAVRKLAATRAEAANVQERHGSRKRPAPKRASTQLSLLS